MESDKTIAAPEVPQGRSSEGVEMPPESRVQVAIGQRIAGKYLVERVLGQGGMGIVVAARHETLGNRVAIKFLLEEALVNAEAVQRFIREAQAVTKLQSEHIARVIDVGTLDNSAPYMVMEYLEGRDLADALESEGVLPVADAVDAILQSIDAIAEAHALGIVHRDLKPANLYVTTRTDGSTSVKVLDFGISKSTQPDAQQRALTSTRSMMGSPLYMSPEQVRSAKSVDTRSDLWSLGVILFELLAGKPPFDGDTIGEVFAAILTADVPSLRALRPEVPAELEAVIASCLTRDLSARIPDVAALAKGIAPFGSRRVQPIVERVEAVLSRAGRLSMVGPMSTRPSTPISPEAATQLSTSPPSTAAGVNSARAPGAGTSASPSTTLAEWGKSSTGSSPPQKQTNPLVAAAIGAVVVALLAGGGYMAFGRGTSSNGVAPAGLVSSAAGDPAATTPASTVPVVPSSPSSGTNASTATQGSATPMVSATASSTLASPPEPTRPSSTRPASTTKPAATSGKSPKGGLPDGRD